MIFILTKVSQITEYSTICIGTCLFVFIRGRGGGGGGGGEQSLILNAIMNHSNISM